MLLGICGQLDNSVKGLFVRYSGHHLVTRLDVHGKRRAGNQMPSVLRFTLPRVFQKVCIKNYDKFFNLVDAWELHSRPVYTLKH